MRAATPDEQKLEDLLKDTISNPGVGLIGCTDFQISARIPLPTPSATLPPGEGILPPRWGGGRFVNRPYRRIGKHEKVPVRLDGDF